jgi:hypothetical protein
MALCAIRHYKELDRVSFSPDASRAAVQGLIDSLQRYTLCANLFIVSSILTELQGIAIPWGAIKHLL